ncbi:MAG: hypothetical protein U1F11_05980 [Steroidobacteraceae bacterium]
MTVRVFVPDLRDFRPLIEAVRAQPGLTLLPRGGYWELRAPRRLNVSRKALGLRVALWYSMLAGGFCGRMTEYSRDTLTIDSEDAA